MLFLVFIAFDFELFCALVPLLPRLDNIIATTEWTFHLHPFPTIPCLLLVLFIYHGNRGISYMYRFETRLVIAIQQRKCCAARPQMCQRRIDPKKSDLLLSEEKPASFRLRRKRPLRRSAGASALSTFIYSALQMFLYDVSRWFSFQTYPEHFLKCSASQELQNLSRRLQNLQRSSKRFFFRYAKAPKSRIELCPISNR